MSQTVLNKTASSPDGISMTDEIARWRATVKAFFADIESELVEVEREIESLTGIRGTANEGPTPSGSVAQTVPAKSRTLPASRNEQTAECPRERLAQLALEIEEKLKRSRGARADGNLQTGERHGTL